MAAKVVARSWCRVDLAGGTLDIWPLGLLHPGARTVNLAIDLEVRIELTRAGERYRVRQGGAVVEGRTLEQLTVHPEAALVGLVAQELGLPPVEATLSSRSPRGGGLGASSAIAVGLIAAGEALLERPPSSIERRAALARDLEARLMSLPTGTQDHYAALLGGALEIVHRPGGETWRSLEIDLDRVGRSLLVIYTGESHFSASNNWQVIRRRLDGDRRTADLFDGIAAVTERLVAALEAGDLAAVGGLMSEEWSLRRRLADGVSTPVIERLLDQARSCGAWGGKVCGAGGGGCIALLCPPERRDEVGARLRAAGGTALGAAPVAAAMNVEIVEA